MLSATGKYRVHRGSLSMVTTLWSSFRLRLDAAANIVLARLKVPVLLLTVCFGTAMFWSAGAVALSAGAEPTTLTFSAENTVLTLVQPAVQRQADRSEAVDFVVRFGLADGPDGLSKADDVQVQVLAPRRVAELINYVGAGGNPVINLQSDRTFYNIGQGFNILETSSLLSEMFTVRLYPNRSIDSPADQSVLLNFLYQNEGSEAVSSFLDIDRRGIELDELIELRALASCTSELSRYWSGARLLFDPEAQSQRNISLFGVEKTTAVQLVNVVVEHFRRDGKEQLSLSDDMLLERRVERPADARLLLRADIVDNSGTVVHSAIQCDSARDRVEMCEYDPQLGEVGDPSVYFARPALQFGGPTSGLQVGERTGFGLRVQTGGEPLRMSLSLLYPDGSNHPEGRNNFTAHWVSQGAPQQESCALPTDDLEGALLNFRDLEDEFCDLAVLGGAEGTSCGLLAPVSADSTAVVAFSPPADWQVTADEAGTGEALLREVPANSADGCISLQLPEGRVLSRLALRYSIDPPVPGHFQLRLESAGVLSGPFASTTDYDSAQTWNSFEYPGVRQNPPVGVTIMLCHATGESTTTSSLRIDDIELETLERTALPNCASELPNYWGGARLLLDPGAQPLRNVSLFGAGETNTVQTVTAVVEHFRGDGSEQLSLSDDMSADNRVGRPADARLLLRADIEDSSGTVVHSAIQCNSAGERAEMCEYDPQDGTVGSMSVYFARPALQFVDSSTSGLQIGESTTFSLRVQMGGEPLQMSLSLLYPNGVNHPDTREDFTVFWSSQGFSGQNSCALPTTDNLEGARLNFRDLESEFCDLAVVGGAEGASCGLLAPNVSNAVVAFLPPAIWQVTEDEAGTGEALLRDVPANMAEGCISLRLPGGQVLSRLALRYSVEPALSEHFELRFRSRGVLSDPVASIVEYDITQEWNSFEYRGSGQDSAAGVTIELCHSPAGARSSLRIDDIELETIAELICESELRRYWDGASLLLGDGEQSVQSVSLFGAGETNAVQTVTAVVKHFREDGSEQLSLSDDMSGDRRVERPADARLLLRADIEDSDGNILHRAVQCDSNGDLSPVEMCEYLLRFGLGKVGNPSGYFARTALRFIGSTTSGLQIGERTEFALRVQPRGGSLRMSLSLLYPNGRNHPDDPRENFTVFMSSGDFVQQKSCPLRTNLRGARLNFRDLEGEFCDLAVVGGADGASCGLLAPLAPDVSAAVVAFSPPEIWRVTEDESGTGEALVRAVQSNSVADGCISLQLPEEQVLLSLAFRYSIQPAVPEHFELRFRSRGVLSAPVASIVEYDSMQEWNSFEYLGAGQNPPVGGTIRLCHTQAGTRSVLRIDDIALDTTTTLGCASELAQYWDGARLLLGPGEQPLRNISLFGAEETNAVQTVNAVVKHFRRDGSEQQSLSDDISGLRVERPADARLLLRADIEDRSGTVVRSAIQCDSAEDDDLLETEMCEYDPLLGTVSTRALNVYFESPALQFVGSSTSGLQIGERTEFSLRVQPGGDSLRMSLSLLYPDGVNHPDTREEFAVFQGGVNSARCALPTSGLQGARLNFRDLEDEFCDLAVVDGAEGSSCGLLAPVPSSSPAVVAFSPPTIWQVTADEAGTGEALLRAVPENSAVSSGCISLQLPEGQVLSLLALRYSIDPPVPEHFELRFESEGVLSAPIASIVEYDRAQEWNRFQYRDSRQNSPVGATIRLCHVPGASASSLRLDDIQLRTAERIVLPDCASELPRYWDGARLLLDPGAQSLQSVSLFGADDTNAVQTVNAVVEHFRGDGSEQLSLSDDMSGPQRVKRPAGARLLLRADIEDSDGNIMHSAIQCDSAEDADLLQTDMCEYDPLLGTVRNRTLNVYFAHPALQFGSSASGLQIGERTEFSLRVRPSGGSLRMSLSLLYPNGVNHPESREDFAVFWISQGFSGQESCALPTENLEAARLNFRDLEDEFCDLAVVGGAEGASCGLLAEVSTGSTAVVAFSPPEIWQVTADELGTGEALLRAVPANSADGCINLQLPEGRLLSRLALRYSVEPVVPEHFQLRLESAGVLSGPFASAVGYSSTQTWNSFEYSGFGQNPLVGASIMLCHAPGESTSTLRIDDIELETLESTALPSCASELPEYWNGARLLLDPGAQSLQSVSLFGADDTNAVQTVNAVVKHFRGDGSEQRSLSGDMSGPQRVERPADARLLLRADIENSSGTVVHSAIQCDSAEDDDLLQTEMCEYDPQDGTVSTRTLSVYFARPALQFVGSSTSGLQIGERTEFSLRVQPGGDSLRMSLSLLYPDGDNHPDTRENFAVFWSSQGFSGQNSCALPTDNLEGARLNFRDLEGEFCDLAVVGGAEGASCGLLAMVSTDSTAVVDFSPPEIWQVTADEAGTGEALLRAVPANSADGCISLQLPEGRLLSRLALRYSIEPAVPEHFQLRLESAGVLSGPFDSAVGYSSTQTWNSFEYRDSGQNPLVGASIMLCHAPGESTSTLRIDDIELETLESTALPSCASELPEYWNGARLLLDPGAQSLQSVSLFGADDTNAVQTVNAVVKHFRRDGSELQSLSDDISGLRVERPADARLLLRADIVSSTGTVVHRAIQCDSAEDADLLETEMCQYDPLLGTVSTRTLSVYFARPALEFVGSSTSGLQIGERTEFSLRVQPSGGSLRISLSLLYPDGDNHPETREEFTVFPGSVNSARCALPTSNLEGARLNFRDLEGEFCDLAVVGGAEGTSCGLLATVSTRSTAVVAFLPPTIWQVTADEAGTGEALLREVPTNSADGCINLQLPEGQVLSRLALRYSIEPPVPEHFQLRLESEGALSGPFASAVGYSSTQTWNSFEYSGSGQNPPVGASIMLCHAPGESTSSLRIDDIELETLESTALPNCASELPEYWNGARLLLDPGAQSLQSVSLFGTDDTNAVQTVNAVVEHFRRDGSEQLSLSDDMSGPQRVERPADARLLLRADIEDSDGNILLSAIQCDGSGGLSQAEMCEYDPQQGTIGAPSVYFASPALEFVGSSTSGLQIGERTEFALRVQPSGGSLRMSLSLLYPDTREDFAIFWSSQGFSGQESCALPTDNLEGARLNFRDLEGEFCDLAVLGGAEGASCGLLAPLAPDVSTAVVAFLPPAIWQVTADEAGTGEALLRAVPANSADGCINLRLPEGRLLSRLALRYSIDPPVPGHFQLRLESAGVLSDPIASAVDYDSRQEWNRFEYRGSGQNPPVGASIMLCHAPGASTSTLRIDDIELETLESTALPSCASELPEYWDGARLLLDPGAQSLQSVSLFGAEDTSAVQTVNAVVKHFRGDGSEQMSLSDDMSGPQRVERPADARLLLRADIEDISGTVVHSAIQCDSAEDDDLLQTEMCEYDPQDGTVSTRTLSVYFARPALEFGSSASGLQIGERTEFSLHVQPSGGSLRMSLSLLYPDGDNHPDIREDFAVFWSSQGFSGQESCALPTDNLEGARLNFRDLEGEFCDLAVVGGAEGASCGLLATVSTDSTAVVDFSPPEIWQVTADEAGTGEALLRAVPANSAGGCINLQLPEGQLLSRLALRYSIDPPVSEHFELRIESEGVLSDPIASAVDYDSRQEWNRFEYRDSGQNPSVGATIMLCHAPAGSTSTLRIDDIALETTALLGCALELSEYWNGARLLLDPGAQSLQNVSLFGAEETNAVQTVNAVVKHFRRDGSEQRSLSDDISGLRVERPADARLLLRADIEDGDGNILLSAIQCDSAEDDDLLETEMCQYDPLLGTVSTRALNVYFESPALEFASAISGLQIGESTTFSLRVQPGGDSLRISLSLLYPDGDNHPEAREEFTVFPGSVNSARCALPTSNLEGARLNFRDLEGEFCDLAVVGGAEGTSCGLLAPVPSSSPAVVAFSPPTIWQVTADEAGTGEALLRAVPANSADGCINLQLPEGRLLSRLALRYSIEPAVSEHFQLRLESEGVLSDPITSAVDYDSMQEWNRFEYRGSGQNPPVGASIMLCHAPGESTSTLRIDDIELETLESTALPSCASELPEYWDGARLLLDPGAQSLQSVSLFGTEDTNAVQTVNAVVEHFRRDGSEQLSLSDDMSGDNRVERPADARLLLRADIEDGDGNILLSAIQCDSAEDDDLFETEMCEYDPLLGTVSTRALSVYFARPALEFGSSSVSGLQIGESTTFSLRVQPGGDSLRLSLGLLYPDGDNHPDTRENFAIFWSSQGFSGQESCALPTDNFEGARLNFRDLEGEFCDLAVRGGADGASCGLLAPVAPDVSTAVVAFSPPEIWQVTADEAGTGEALLRAVPANSAASTGCISLQLPEGRLLSRLALRYSIEPAVPEHFELRLESEGVLSDPITSAVGYSSTQEWNRFEYRGSGQNPPVGASIMLCHAPGASTSSLRIDDIELETLESTALPSCASELPRYWDGARLLLDPGAQSLQSVSLFGAEDTNAVQTVNAVVKHFRRDGSEQLSLSDDMSGDNRVERPADARLLLRADIEDGDGNILLSAIQCDSAEDDDLFETEMCQYDLQDGTVSTRALSAYFASPALQFVGSTTSGLQIGERTEFALRVQAGGEPLQMMSLSLLYPNTRENFAIFWSSQGFSGQESCALPTDNLEGARLNFRDLEDEFCDLAVLGGAEGASCGLLAPLAPDVSTAVVAFLPPAIWQVTADEAGTGEALLRAVPANSADGCINLRLPEGRLLSRLALRYSIDPPVPGHFQLRLESAGVLSDPIASAVDYDSRQEWNRFEYRGSGQNPPVGASIMLCHAPGASTSTLRIDDIELETLESTALPSCASELPEYWDGARLLLDPGAQSLQSVSLFGTEDTNTVQTVNAVVKHFRGDGSEQMSLSDDMSGPQRVERPADARLLLRADIEDSSGTVVHSAIQCDSAEDADLLQTEMCEYDPQDGTVSTRTLSVYFARPALEFGSSASGLQIGESSTFSLRVQPGGDSLRMSLSLLYPDGDNHPDTRENFAVFWSSQGFSGQESCALPTDNLEGARLNFRDLEGEFCDLAVVGGAEGTSCGLLATVSTDSTAVVDFSPPEIWQVTADEAGTGEALLRAVPANSAGGCINLQLPEGQLLSRLALRYSVEPAMPEHFELRIESEGVLSDPIASAVDYDRAQEWNRFEYRDSGQNPSVGATIMLCHAPGASTSTLRIDDIALETTALLGCALELSEYWNGARLLLDPGAQSLQNVSLFGAEETNAVQTVNAVVKHFRRDGSEQQSLSDDISGLRVERPADARLLLRADIEDSSGTVVHSAIQCDGSGGLSQAEMCEYDPQQGKVSTRTLSVYFASPALEFGSSASGLQIGERTEFALHVQPGGDSLRISLSLLYPDGDNHPETREEFTVFPGSVNSARCALPTSNLEGARLNFRDLEGEFCDLAVVGGAEGTSCGLLPVPSSSSFAVGTFSPPTIWQVTADEAGTGEALLRAVPANSDDGCISLPLPEGRLLSGLALRYSVDPPVPEHFQLLLESEGVLSGPFASAVGYSSTQTWNSFEYRGSGQNPPVGATIMLCHAPGESTSSLRIDDIELETLESTALPSCASELPEYWDGARLLLGPGSQSLQNVSLFGTEDTNAVQTVNAVVKHFRGDRGEQQSLSDDMSGERRVERPADARLLLRADIEDSFGTVVHSAIQCDSAEDDDLLETEMCEYDPLLGTVGTRALSAYFASPALQFVGSSTSGLQIGERTEFALRVQPSGGSLRMNLSLLYPDGDNHPETRENFAIFWSSQGFSGQESCALPTDNLEGARLNFRDLEGEFCDLAVLGGAEGTSCGLLAPIPTGSSAVVDFSPPADWQVTADESGAGEALLREVPANSVGGCLNLQLPEGRLLSRLALRYSIEPAVPEHFQLLLESAGVLSGPFDSAVGYSSRQTWNSFEYSGSGQNPPVGATIMLCHAPGGSASILRIDDIELETLESTALPSCASELPEYWNGARLLLDPGAQSLQSVSLFGTEDTNTVQTVNAVVKHFRGDGSEQMSLSDDMSGEQRVERPADARLLLRADIVDSTGTVVHSAIQCDSAEDDDLLQTEMCEYDPQQGTVSTRTLSVYFARPALQFVGSSTSGLQIGERTEFSLRVQPSGGSLRMNLSLLYPDGDNHPDTRENFAIFWSSQGFSGQESCALPTENLEGARLNFRDLEGEFCDLAVVGGAEGTSCGLLATVSTDSTAVVDFSPPEIWQVTADEAGTGEALLRAVPANSAGGCIGLQLPEGQVLSRLALRYSVEPAVPEHFELRIESEGGLE